MSIFVNIVTPHITAPAEIIPLPLIQESTQTALRQFFVFSSLPVKLVADLFLAETFSSLLAQKPVSQEQRGTADARNTSAQDGLLPTASGGTFLRGSSQPAPGDGTSRFYSLSSLHMPALIAQGLFVQSAMAGLLVLLFFFLLPRSSLSDGGIILAMIRFYTQRAFARWVFYFNMKTAYRRVS